MESLIVVSIEGNRFSHCGRVVGYKFQRIQQSTGGRNSSLLLSPPQAMLFRSPYLLPVISKPVKHVLGKLGIVNSVALISIWGRAQYHIYSFAGPAKLPNVL